MADIEKKRFLDEAGLQIYDELIKAYIKQGNSTNQESINSILEALANLSTTVTTDEEQIQANKTAIETLNGDTTTEGSVDKKIADAVAALVNGAPEALDTLKEIADWINNDESGATTLVSRVDAIEDETANLKSYVDAQDLNYYNSITSINEASISSLFKTAVQLKEGQTISDALASLEEDEKLVLDEGSEVTEDIVVPEGATIDANGSTFSGQVTVPESAVIQNAVFTGKVVVG